MPSNYPWKRGGAWSLTQEQLWPPWQAKTSCLFQRQGQLAHFFLEIKFSLVSSALRFALSLPAFKFMAYISLLGCNVWIIVKCTCFTVLLFILLFSVQIVGLAMCSTDMLRFLTLSFGILSLLFSCFCDDLGRLLQEL